MLHHHLLKRDDIFEVLENDIRKFSRFGECIVCGDFNARTAVEADFCNDNDGDYNMDHLDLPFNYINDLPLTRNNMDLHAPDAHGKALISLCRTSGLRILNGRTVGDTLGYSTCFSHNGQPSVIDYMLASSTFLNNVEYLYVHPPSELSIHCMMSANIRASIKSITTESETELHPPPPKYIWDNTSSLKYQQALLNPQVQKTISCFLNAELSIDTIDDAVKNINDIVTGTADTAGIRHVSYVKCLKKRKKRKWFDLDCISLRRELRKIGAKLQRNPLNVHIRQSYKVVRKQYKKFTKHKMTAFKDTILKQLDNLNENNPQSFWKLYDDLVKLDKEDKANPISSSEWVKHFNQLFSIAQQANNSDFQNHIDEYLNSHTDSVFNSLNFHINTNEISKAISKLKLGKSSGLDSISNEMIKAGSTTLLPLFQKLFNFIFTHNYFPNSWRYNSLTPIHKKGDINDTNNYRGIALTSNLCKLFSTVLHTRLVAYTNKNNMIPPNQIGYKKGTRPADHILTLKTIIDKYTIKLAKGNLFACFVDFKKAFDTVNRKALYYKLLKQDIGGNFLKILQHMYQEVFFCVKLPGGLTKSFSSHTGVKQGCVLSPILFNIFISDLPAIFDASCDPVELHDITLSCLLFADDLVIVSKTATGLQTSLNKLEKYCSKWNLYVNIAKTNVVIFNKSGKLLNKKHQFFYGNQLIEISRSYKYLGIIFSCCGSFTKAMEHLTDQAQKALFKLRQQDIQNNIMTGLKLFDSLILPIIMYSSEIWGPFTIKKT